MRTLHAALSTTLPVLLSLSLATHAQNAAPHLEKRGQATQLIVDGSPFLMLAGELHNSSSSSLDYMKPIWSRLAGIPLNTVLTPISWELVEPVKGHYDFTLIDGLLAQAREQHLHIVFLWLAAWKNGMSSYDPVYVKEDTKRYPRVMIHNSEAPILSVIEGYSQATRDADSAAFAAVMAHLKETDSRDHTVLMMQVENEVGILGATRDHSPAAEKAFSAGVPSALTSYLQEHRDNLNSELRDLWFANGARTSGSWGQVFGESARADEIFMAWNYARYVQSVAVAGKSAYNIPMYVNAWLGGGDATPGEYPSGGPQPRVIDVWKAAGVGSGAGLDIIAPDLYKSDFYDWATRYHRPDNPLFIPETNGGVNGAANVFYAVGEHGTLGFSPFAIDAPFAPENAGTASQTTDPILAGFLNGATELGKSYSVIASMMPVILDAQTRGATRGFTLTHDHPSVEFEMGPCTVHVSLDEIFGNHAEKGYGLMILTSSDERGAAFLGAGRGFRVLVTPRAPGKHMGIASIDEGTYQDGKWVPGRRLNGDENDQGNYWRFDQRVLRIEKATYYNFD